MYYRTPGSKSDILTYQITFVGYFTKPHIFISFIFGPAKSSTVGMDVSSSIWNANKERVVVEMTKETKNTRYNIIISLHFYRSAYYTEFNILST